MSALARRAAARTIVVVVALSVIPAVAAAENPTVTMQAEAANARFLAFAPPPPGGAAAVCLVDTGLDVNPDTAASASVRLALDGGDPGDVHRTRHGTRMAMLMGGPVNDWGSVGIWPHVRIVSIRAMPPGETAFPFHYYEQAVIACGERAERDRLAVVNLSLGGTGPTQEQVERLGDVIQNARAQGVSVVAAAGNGAGAVEYPAAIPGAFAVTGSGRSGELCPFSARGEAIDLVAPGCGLDAALADGRPASASGTSDAAAVVSAVLAALRSYRPDLTAEAAERLLLETATRGRVDAEAAFHAAGLGDVVAAGDAAVPVEPPPRPASAEPAPSVVAAPPPPLARPRLGALARRRGRLVARCRGRPPGAMLVARVVFAAGRGEFRLRERTAARAAATVSIRAPAAWRRLELRYRTGERESAPLVVRRRARARAVGGR